MRHRQYKRMQTIDLNVHIQNLKGVNKSFILKNIDKYQQQLLFKNKIVALLKKNKPIMKEARVNSGYHPHYNGGNYIQAIAAEVRKHSYPFYYMPRKDGHLSYKVILELHDSYMAECTLLGIKLENPYEIEDDCPR